MKEINNKHIGSAFDDFLEEVGILSDVTSLSHKQIIAIQIQDVMNKLNMSKIEMARRMHTSRSAVDRLLNPNNPNVTIDTIDRAARALGMNLILALRSPNICISSNRYETKDSN
jgi:DNA-binding phage protein